MRSKLALLALSGSLVAAPVAFSTLVAGSGAGQQAFVVGASGAGRQAFALRAYSIPCEDRRGDNNNGNGGNWGTGGNWEKCCPGDRNGGNNGGNIGNCGGPVGV
jgi:hypothetical protein